MDDFQCLIQAFDQAIQKKQKNNFGKPEIDAIYKAAHEFFSHHDYVEPKRLEQIRDKWVELASERIDKGRAMKKLQGVGRADAIRAILLTMNLGKK